MSINSIIGFIKARREFLKARYLALSVLDDSLSSYKRKRCLVRILELDFLLSAFGCED